MCLNMSFSNWGPLELTIHYDHVVIALSCRILPSLPSSFSELTDHYLIIVHCHMMLVSVLHLLVMTTVLNCLTLITAQWQENTMGMIQKWSSSCLVKAQEWKATLYEQKVHRSLRRGKWKIRSSQRQRKIKRTLWNKYILKMTCADQALEKRTVWGVCPPFRLWVAVLCQQNITVCTADMFWIWILLVL